MYKTLKDFIKDNKIFIDNEDYTQLFKQLYLNDMPPFDLQKLLAQAKINYKLYDHTSGSIMNQLDTFNMDDLVEIGTDLLSDDYGFEVVEDKYSTKYIANHIDYKPVYYNKDNFIKMLYDTIMESLYDDENFYYDLIFYNYGIDGRGDPLFDKLLYNNYIDMSSLPDIQTIHKIDWS